MSAFLFVAALAAPISAWAQAAVDVLHTFTYYDRPEAVSALAIANDQTVYGASCQGGTHNRGTIFKLTDSGGVVVYSFGDEFDCPASLVLGSDGNFYGTTYLGGADGGGVAFRFTPPSTVVVLHPFQTTNVPTKQGSNSAFATLIRGTDGSLYGLARDAESADVLFRLTTDGAYSVVRTFTSGHTPDSVIQATDGNFYVTKLTTIFRVTPLGAVSELYTPTNGILAPAIQQGTDGHLYTIVRTPDAPTTLIRVTLSGAVTELHVFETALRPDLMIAGADGRLYFSGRDGPYNNGVITSSDLNGNLTVLHTFWDLEPEYQTPAALAVSTDGRVYGAARSGQEHLGLLFRINSDRSRTSWPIARTAEGWNLSGIIQASDGHFYGATRDGGVYGQGTIYRMARDGTTTVLHAFSGTDGSSPGALIEASDGTLCGVAPYGSGPALDGVVFCLEKSGDFRIVHHFSWNHFVSGARPVQGSDGYLYILAVAGGTWGGGVVFRIGLDGAFSVLHEFGATATEPRNPTGLVEASDGAFYGTSWQGGLHDKGTVFRLTKAGTTTVLYSFNDSPRAYPNGPLIQASDGNLYGTVGGDSSFELPGYVFRITLDGAFTVLRRFDDIVGSGDGSGLIQASDGNLYGHAFRRVYKLTLDGHLTVVKDFEDFIDNPLIQASDGNLYGTSAPAAVVGNVFRLRIGLSALMALDMPSPNRDSVGPLTIAGWALDRSAFEETGVDAVHVWAFPLLPGGALGGGMFLGVGDYGVGRPDVADVFGGQFLNAGFTLGNVRLAPGRYRIAAYAHSVVSGTFDAMRSVDITVSTTPLMNVDTPHSSSTVDAVFDISGWAVEFGALSGTGVDAVHIWAFPANTGSPMFLGAASVGLARQDIADMYGSQYADSGFRLIDARLPPGGYQIVAFAHSSQTGSFNNASSTSVIVATPDPAMVVDSPTPGTVNVPFDLVGWAIDRGGTTGPGVDMVHVWAFPDGGGTPTFVGAASYGLMRGDVGAFFGPRFAESGFSLTVNSLAPGTYDLMAFAWSTVSRSFNQQRGVRVTIPAP